MTFKGGAWEEGDEFDTQLKKTIKELIKMDKEISKIIVEHKEMEKLQDSLEIGTASKGGGIKVYLDFDKPEMCKIKIENAIKMRTFAQEQLN